MAVSEENVKEPVVATAEARKSFEEQALARLENFGGVRSEKNPWSLTVVVNSARLHDAVLAVRDELGLDMLLDIVGIDYLGFKDYAGPRFAVEYVFKSVYDPAKRLILKVFAEEADLKIPTISDLYEIANWQEREVYDQYGVTFVGHPDLQGLSGASAPVAFHERLSVSGTGKAAGIQRLQDFGTSGRNPAERS